jgi:alpha-L-fucosidase
MNRRGFVSAAGAAALGVSLPGRKWAQQPEPPIEHRLPATDIDFQRAKSYVEEVPVHQYHWASGRAVEAFNDIKFGLRIHWGIYSTFGRPYESWPFLSMPFEERQKYNEAYKTWNPREFDAEDWMNLCNESGLRMFAFTTKHHEGFSMFDTKTRVRSRANWTAPGGPRIEDCDLAYSIMETPFATWWANSLLRHTNGRSRSISISPIPIGTMRIFDPTGGIRFKSHPRPNSGAGRNRR